MIRKCVFKCLSWKEDIPKIRFQAKCKNQTGKCVCNSETLLLKKKSAEMKTVTYSKSTNN